MKKTLKGFTLIEMLIVIVIIGILAAVLIPKIGGARQKAEDVAVKANVRSYAQGILQMQLENDPIPTKFDACGSGDDNCVALNDTANAEKYNYNYVGDAAGYTYNAGNGNFLICGTVSGGGNSNSQAGDGGTGTKTASNWTEETDGDLLYYCYKG